MAQYAKDTKRAAVDVFKWAQEKKKQFGVEWLDPIEVASVAARGASRSSVYAWMERLEEGLSLEQHEEKRGRPRSLTEDQESLLVGFATTRRSNLEPVTLDDIKHFCDSYLTETISKPSISRIMNDHGFSSQRTMARGSRMVTQEVVEDALLAIEEIRSYNFPPHRVIVMDETGLWSNVTKPKTYHFVNWYASP